MLVSCVAGVDTFCWDDKFMQNFWKKSGSRNFFSQNKQDVIGEKNICLKLMKKIKLYPFPNTTIGTKCIRFKKLIKMTRAYVGYFILMAGQGYDA